MGFLNPDFPHFAATNQDGSFPMQGYANNLSPLPVELQLHVLDFQAELGQHNEDTIVGNCLPEGHVLSAGFNKTVLSAHRLWLEALKDGGAEFEFLPLHSGSSQVALGHDESYTQQLERAQDMYDHSVFPARVSAGLGIAHVIDKQCDRADICYAPELSRSALGDVCPEQTERDTLINRVFMTSAVAKAATVARVMPVEGFERADMDYYSKLSANGMRPFTITEQQAFVAPAAAHILK